MSDDEKTKAELREEIHALKAELRDERRRARRAEARAGSLWNLVSEPAGAPVAVHASDDEEAEGRGAWWGRAPAPLGGPPAEDASGDGSDEAPRRLSARSLLELLPDAILILGAADRVRYANSAAAGLLGTAHRALEGDSVWDHLRLGAGRRRDTTEAPTDFSEHDFVRRRGEAEPLEATSVPIVYRGEPASLTVLRRPPDAAPLTETVTRTLDLFDKAFHLGPAALLIARLRDGLVLEASDRTVELSGYATDELVGRTVEDLEAGPSDRDRRAFTRDLLQNGTVRNRELRVRRSDGEPRDLLCSAQIAEVDGEACALVSFVDVTRRKRAAVAERESRTLLQTIFRSSPAPIVIFRLDDETIVDANEAMGALVDRPREALVGRTPEGIDLWKNPERGRALVDELRRAEALHDREVDFRTADGATVTTLASLQRIQIDGRPCALAVMTDITSREETREALVEAKEKAEEAREKAEEVAHFRSAVLANMTHEVRTPLTVILGFTSTLREGVSDDYQRFVDLIERSGRRLLLTLDSLLDLAQIEAGTLDPDVSRACVPDALRGISGSLAQLAQDKGVDFSLDAPEERICAEIDVDLFGRVVNHLVDNAVKFTDEGRVLVRVRGDADTVRIEIEDTGAGIGKEFLPHATDAFAQESEGMTRSHQGSGLGLTVSQRIVERMDGRLEIESTKGEGTTVTVVLPRAEGRV
jgi:PAS domain S-box-containing protein